MAAKAKRRKNPKTKRRRLIRVVSLCLLFVAVTFFVKIQIDVMAEIAAEQKNIDQLNQQIEERSLANQEMRDNLANGTNEDYLRKKARERGYVYPDERVYIDITGE